MTTNDLIVEIAKITGIDLDKVRMVEKELFATIVKTLKNNEKVRVEHFGFFIPFVTKEKMGRNMRTGEKILIPSKKKIKFKPSKDTKTL